MYKLCALVLLMFVIEESNSFEMCPNNMVGEHVTACNNGGWRCYCYPNPKKNNCNGLCPGSFHPNPKCKKRYVLPVFRNATSGEGCCKQFNCPYGYGDDSDDYEYGCGWNYGDGMKKPGYVMRNCHFLNALKCWCDGKKLSKCTPLCTVRPDFNPYMCHMELPDNYMPWPAKETAHNCCPKVVCDWDNRG